MTNPRRLADRSQVCLAVFSTEADWASVDDYEPPLVQDVMDVQSASGDPVTTSATHTGNTALRLGQWFRTSAQFWLNLQSAYEIRVAEERAGEEIARLPAPWNGFGQRGALGLTFTLNWGDREQAGRPPLR